MRTLIRLAAVFAAVNIFALVEFGGLAIAQVTPGVTRSAAHTANITGTVTQSNGAPIAGANVNLTGPAVLSAKTDSKGNFSFTAVPYGAYQIDVTSSQGVVSRSIALSGDVNITVQFQPPALRTIAHVSTSSAGTHINVTPASIASVNPSDYAFRGNTSWQTLLNVIPGVNTGGLFAGGSTATSSVVGSPLASVVPSINGALPYETAVMIDGMPFHNVAASSSTLAGFGTDLSNVPMAAFETADVVRGPGANAPSIVGSIGGTLVLHGPGEVNKNAFELSVSNDAYGGIVSNFKGALRSKRLSATIIYGSYNSPGPLGPSASGVLSQTPTILTIDGRPFLGCTSTGGSCLTGPTLTTAQYQNCYSCGITDNLLVGGVPESTAWSQHSYGTALSYNLSPSVNVELSYMGSAAAGPFPSFLEPIDFAPAQGYSGSIAPGTHDYFNPNVYNTFIKTSSRFLEEKVTAFLGKDVLHLAAIQDTFYDKYSTGSLFAPPDGQYRLWGVGYLGSTPPGTPATFNGEPHNLTFFSYPYNFEGRSDSRDILLSYATQIGTASTFGISYVTSYYNNPWDFSLGTLVSGSQPSSVSATTNEFRVFGSAQVSDRFSVDASWYFANGSFHVQNPDNLALWSDADYPYNAPRLGATWRANRDMVIRAAAGGGYALPPLYYLIGSNAIFPAGSYYYQVKTNLHLAPERSFAFDLGTDMRFHRDTVFSFDLYRTNLYGQFYNSTTLTGTYGGLPLYTNQQNNLGQSRYEGVNVAVSHDVPMGLYWQASLGLTRAYLLNVPPGFYDDPLSGPNSINTYIIPGINFDGPFYQSTVPYATAAAQIGYRWGPGKYVDLSPSYYGNNNSYFEPAFVELDAHAGYALTKNFSLLATFSNVTNVYGRNYQLYSPTTGAPAVGGPPFALFGIPYGPRTVILTADFRT